MLACGRLVPYKGYDVLIRAAVNRKFEAWIIGEGAERPRLEQLIAELGLGDRVRLLGSVSDCERIKLMCLADVFVMPSSPMPRPSASPSSRPWPPAAPW